MVNGIRVSDLRELIKGRGSTFHVGSRGGARGVMDKAARVQILDETDCILHSTNTLGNGMNPIILPPAMGK